MLGICVSQVDSTPGQCSSLLERGNVRFASRRWPNRNLKGKGSGGVITRSTTKEREHAKSLSMGNRREKGKVIRRGKT